MPININADPYYDDFNADKNFHQILFRPGYSVQARELTQLQSILRDQIAKFGNHVFQQGSVVIPGNSFTDLETPYIKLQPTFNSAAVSAAQFKGKIIVGATNGVKAYVRDVVAATSTDPITFYLSYTKGGGGTGTSNEFLASEEVYIETASTIRASLAVTNPIGFGSLAFVNRGVFYVNGAFVTVVPQSVIISKYSSAPNCHVLLQINETIVDNLTDSTLLDPAQGSYNYSAPGADRLKIALVLTSLAIDSTISSNYIELMRYRGGVLEEHSRYPKYSELEKSLARRTFDESGDYVVSGFRPSIRDHLRTKFNNGASVTGDRNKFVIDVNPGKAYIGGFEVEQIAPTQLVLDKARTAAHVKNKKITFQNRYGDYLYVTNLKSLPNFRNRQTVNLFNDDDPANAAATLIGTMRVLAVDYHAGDPATNTAIYKLFYSDIVLTAPRETQDIGGFRFDAAGSGTVLTKLKVPNATKDFAVAEIISNAAATRTATVARYTRSTAELFIYKHDHTKYIPNVGEIVTGNVGSAPFATGTVSTRVSSESSGALPLFELPVSSIKSTQNTSNLYDITYSSWKTITISTNGAGTGSQSITDGTFRTPEVGITVAMGPTGVITMDKLSIPSASTITVTGGPVSSTVVILTQVDKIAIQPKAKALTTLILSAVVPATTISLSKADAYRVVSIFSGSIDVTDRYTLDNGQTDYHYGVAKITLNGVLPTANLAITFEYFTHSGSGDYFSIDSYTTLGPDYISLVPGFRSKITSYTYDLSNCLDFRARMGDDGTFTAGTATLVDMPVVDASTASTVQYYVHRVDVAFIDGTKQIQIKTGSPAERPLKPNIPSGSMELFTLLIPAYTTTIDEVIVKRAKNTRFTMSDINKMQDRIANVEYFSTLSAVENSLLTYEIADASTGLNRFKTGYLVDNFDNPFSVCDHYNSQQRSSFRQRRLSAPLEAHDTGIHLTDNSTNFMVTGGMVTLPYIETRFITQATSTRVTNLNPFMVFAWSGVMTIEPRSDSWVVTEDLPTVFNTVDETIIVTREERVFVPVPVPPPVPPTPIVPWRPPPVVEVPAPPWVPPEILPVIPPWVPPMVHPDPPPRPPDHVDPPETPVVISDPVVWVVPVPDVPLPPTPTPHTPVLTYVTSGGVAVAVGEITAWRRDLGLAVPGTPAWDERITFIAPQAEIDGWNASVAGSVIDPALNPQGWSTAIVDLNQLYSVFAGNTQIRTGGAGDSNWTGNDFTGRFSTDQIVDYWIGAGGYENAVSDPRVVAGPVAGSLITILV